MILVDVSAQNIFGGVGAFCELLCLVCGAEKAFRGKLWKAFGMEHFSRRMWELFTVQKTWAKAVFSDMAKERQQGIHGNWQTESPFNEELDMIKRSNDLCVNGFLMRRAYHAGKSGTWESYNEEFQKRGKLSAWASLKVKEWYEVVESEERGRSLWFTGSRRLCGRVWLLDGHYRFYYAESGPPRGHP